jgi:hypothetical protein
VYGKGEEKEQKSPAQICRRASVAVLEELGVSGNSKGWRKIPQQPAAPSPPQTCEKHDLYSLGISQETPGESSGRNDKGRALDCGA